VPTKDPITWDEINYAFAPFAGTALYSIRAEAFFHFSLAATDAARYHSKNAFYPLYLLRRAWRQPAPGAPACPETYLFVCDYPAEPGFGTLRPLMAVCPQPFTVVANAAVLAARAAELAAMPSARPLPADALPEQPCWRQWWSRSGKELAALRATSPQAMQPALRASTLVLRGLMVRAYIYEAMYERIFSQARPLAVITHNDFTSLSYLAGEAARGHGVPDFTLQHGFPSQEYFPACASHYLVWGPRFRELLARSESNTQFAEVGAPRLDPLARPVDNLERPQLRRNGHLQVLFLSQSHSPAFTPQEHQRTLALVAELAKEPWLRLLVRRHPQESTRAFRHPGFRRAHFLSPRLSLRGCVESADVVLSVNSTAMLEAALMGAPVLQLALPAAAPHPPTLDFPWRASGLAEAREMLWRMREPSVRRVCSQEQAPLLASCLNHFGEAAANAWQYIRQVCETRAVAAAATGQGVR
jgi:hypothetical protein